MSEMVKRMAKAILAGDEANDDLLAASGFPERAAEGFALDAIRAMREPTEAMVEAYFDRCRGLGFTAHITATAAWSAMIAAALGEQGEG